MKIEGTGFLPGATVTIGATGSGQRPLPRPVPRSCTSTPRRTPGRRGRDRHQSDRSVRRLAAGYTYVDPESLNFNGTWSGFGNAGQDMAIRLTIENDRLISVSCDTHATVRISPPALVRTARSRIPDRTASSCPEDRVRVAGGGTLDLAPCSNTQWTAGKQ